MRVSDPFIRAHAISGLPFLCVWGQAFLATHGHRHVSSSWTYVIELADGEVWRQPGGQDESPSVAGGPRWRVIAHNTDAGHLGRHPRTLDRCLQCLKEGLAVGCDGQLVLLRARRLPKVVAGGPAAKSQVRT